MHFCDNCGTAVVVDNALTAEEYNIRVKYIVSDDGDIIKENLPDFLSFACRKCGTFKNIDIVDIIADIRRPIIDRLIKGRLEHVFETSDRSSVDEANGVSYCGICPGVIDGTGYCYNDLISQCKVREEILLHG